MFQNIQTQVLAFACRLPLHISASLRSSTLSVVEAVSYLIVSVLASERSSPG